MHTFHFHPVKRRKAMLLTLFLLILFVPGLSTGLVSGFLDSPSENRKLSQFPTLSFSIAAIKKFPAAFDQYMSDHFGFRSDLILMYNEIKFRLFATSPVKKVLVGREGWLYKHNSEQQVKSKISPSMRRLWRVHFEERRDWLKEQGIDFAVVVASNKHSIYPEYLPYPYKPVSKGRKLQLFLSEMERSRVQVIDLTPKLLAERGRRLLYYKTDTHWNFYGGYFGYRKIAEELKSYFPEEDLLDLGSAEIEARTRDTNLYGIMGVNGSEVVDYISPASGWGYRLLEPDTDLLKKISKRGAASVSEHENRALSKAVVIGDSYLGWNRDFLAQHFSRGVFVNLWGEQWKFKETFPVALINQERPDIVLMEFKESRLGFCSKPYCVVNKSKMTNPDQVRQARLRALYAAGQPNEDRLPYRAAERASGEGVAYHLDTSGLAHPNKPVYLVNVSVSNHGKPVTLIADNKGELCRRFKEMEHITLQPGINEALLCLDLTGGVESVASLVVKGGNADNVRITALGVKPHGDVPQVKGPGKKSSKRGGKHRRGRKQ